jgi:TonB family protein
VRAFLIRKSKPSAAAPAFCLGFLVTCLAPFTVYGQQPSNNDVLQSKISRARALAAAHNLDAASTELNSILGSAKDDSMRDVARIMLMDVYLEQADYSKAQALLEDTYKSRSNKDETATHNYFALAGQVINGVREHIARYRSFGISITDPNLPAEAQNDLNRVRVLLERLGGQSKELSADNGQASDAAALMEEVASVRTSIARDQQERDQWQREFQQAREALAASETRISSVTTSGTRAQSSTAQPVTAQTPAAQQSPDQKSKQPRQSSSQHADPAKSSAVPTTAAPTSNAPAEGAQPGAAIPATGAAGKSLLNAGSLTEKAVRSVKPSYPAIAKASNVSGEVVVFVEVDEKGAVSKISKSTGPRLLATAAEDAAKQWKFPPLLIDGQPAGFTGFITFRFSANH